MSRPPGPGRHLVTKGNLVRAAVILVGVVLMAYGCFHPSKVALYVGLLLTTGGVLTGVIDIIMRDGEKASRS